VEESHSSENGNPPRGRHLSKKLQHGSKSGGDTLQMKGNSPCQRTKSFQDGVKEGFVKNIPEINAQKEKWGGTSKHPGY